MCARARAAVVWCGVFGCVVFRSSGGARGTGVSSLCRTQPSCGSRISACSSWTRRGAPRPRASCSAWPTCRLPRFFGELVGRSLCVLSPNFWRSLGVRFLGVFGFCFFGRWRRLVVCCVFFARMPFLALLYYTPFYFGGGADDGSYPRERMHARRVYVNQWLCPSQA